MSWRDVKKRWPAVRHKALVRGFSGIAPYYIVNEFPKSGGTWLAQMLADALDLPFRRNAPIRLERSVTHGHFLNRFGLRNVVVLWRDPRDVLVSYYYHCYFINENFNSPLVKIMKNRLPFEDYNDINQNLPDFIRFLAKTPISPRFSWPEFVTTWSRWGVQTSYEALRSDTVGELIRITRALSDKTLPENRAVQVAEMHSFANAKRKASQTESGDAEISFLREGSLGNWRQHFTRDAEAEFCACGYQEAMETIDPWVWRSRNVNAC